MTSGHVAPPPGAPRRRGFAIASLVIGILSLPTVGLVGIGAILSVVFGVVGLVKASRYPAEYTGKGLAIGGIVCGVVSIVIMPVVMGIIAAIAIPSFLRARVAANERSAQVDVRDVLAAEASYHSTYGYYDTLECVADPSACAPGRSGATGFLAKELAAAVDKAGYRRSFHAGPPETEAGEPRSPTALASYAYVAVPLQPRRTGVRAFCGDARGIICARLDGSMPDPSGGLCPESCEPLR